jgi:predicted nucleotide-binding protein (sugar kinase/HSP70/actin superfamily)
MNIKTPVIGLPYGLIFFEHIKLWDNFFKLLGFKTVISGKTNSFILNDGVVCCTNETCLPVKVFHGHVKTLIPRTDYIFIPRYSSISENELCCPKLCGLPDMLKYNINDDFNIVEIKINVRHQKKDTYKSIKKAAETLGIDYKKMLYVFKETVEKHIGADIDCPTSQIADSNQKAIAVLGHAYMLYDEYLSMNLISKLNSKGYKVYTPSNLNRHTKRANAHPFSNKNFFDTGIDNHGAAFTYLNFPDLLGMIYLSPFACGVDSLAIEFIERRLSKKQMPFLKLTVDEHTGEAGFDTRLEAFLDMLIPTTG